MLEKSLDFDIGGMAITGHGLTRTTIIVRSVVTDADVDAVVEEATGLPTGDEGERTYVTHLGEVRGGGAQPDWSVLSVPLAIRDIAIGFLFVASSEPGTFDAHAERLVRRLADQAALAVDRAVLLERLRTDYARTISALSVALDAAEYRETGHSERVMDYAMAIGERLGLPLEEIELLRFAGLLHDVGKVGLSEEILLKPSKLSAEEMARVRMHAEIGAGILEQIDFLNDIA
ncbi:MAG: HD domain-containing protein, partial [Actinobacteria bacterium]